jgi:hypothetical protein
MSSRGKNADVVRSKVFLSLAVVVLLGVCLYPSISSLYSRYLAWGAEGYCRAILNGATFVGAKSDDYSAQLNYCEHDPTFNWQR